MKKSVLVLIAGFSVFVLFLILLGGFFLGMRAEILSAKKQMTFLEESNSYLSAKAEMWKNAFYALNAYGKIDGWVSVQPYSRLALQSAYIPFLMQQFNHDEGTAIWLAARLSAEEPF